MFHFSIRLGSSVLHPSTWTLCTLRQTGYSICLFSLQFHQTDLSTLWALGTLCKCNIVIGSYLKPVWVPELGPCILTSDLGLFEPTVVAVGVLLKFLFLYVVFLFNFDSEHDMNLSFMLFYGEMNISLKLALILKVYFLFSHYCFFLLFFFFLNRKL